MTPVELYPDENFNHLRSFSLVTLGWVLPQIKQWDALDFSAHTMGKALHFFLNFFFFLLSIVRHNLQ